MAKIPDEQTKDDLKHAQGEAYDKALQYLAGIVDFADSKTVGDYIVTVAAEEAEGLYYQDIEAGGLVWHPPAKDQNQHIEVAVQDKDDKRFIPGLEITAELLDSNGASLGTETCPFLWHPYIFHYGSMWQLPEEGTYTIKVTIKQPEFGRHDQVLGKRYGDTVSITFENAQLSPGREPGGPE